MRKAAFFKIGAVAVLPEFGFDGKTGCGDGQSRQEKFGDLIIELLQLNYLTVTLSESLPSIIKSNGRLPCSTALSEELTK